MFRQHYWDDNRFVKTQAYLSHVKEMRNQEILTAHVGHPDYPAILNFLMQASSLQLEQTRLLSQVIELLPMKGTWFFDGGNITKVQQLPYHSFNVANYFDLGWIAPELQPFKLYYKNTDEKVLYKTLGFAYVTSGYGITKGSSKQDMLTSFGYASDVFREYYTNDRYNSIRGGSGLTGYTDPASNAIREHYRLKEQAYNAAVESAEHYVEGARIYKGLLFDGQNIYIAKHPGATCANYFDLSRVDPDARKREIRFFPGHEKLLYETLGFAFLVSTSVKTPGARREDIIAKHGKAPFKHHYSQQVWRSYEVSYPTQREIEYQKYSEALAIADMQRHMKHVKKRKQIKSIVTLAPAALVGSLIPGVGGVFVSGVIKGAAFSATHAALNGGNIEKAAFQGAVFAGVGGFAGKGPIGIVATSLVDSGLNGGNPLKKIGTTLAVNHIVDLAGLPEGLTKEFVKAGASSLISGSDIGTALMAGAIGAAGSLSQQVGEELGNGVKDIVQEKVIEKPKKQLMITDGNKDDKQSLNNKHNMRTQETNVQNTINQDLIQRMQAVNKNYKENVVHNSNNTLGVVVIGKDQKSIISTGHGLFYMKDNQGNKTYYENVPNGPRKLKEREYQDIYGHRQHLVKEIELNGTQCNEVTAFAKNKIGYGYVNDNCIDFIKKALVKSGASVSLPLLFSVEELNGVGVGGGIIDRIHPGYIQNHPDVKIKGYQNL
jgi:hypothetical protein